MAEPRREPPSQPPRRRQRRRPMGAGCTRGANAAAPLRSVDGKEQPGSASSSRAGGHGGATGTASATPASPAKAAAGQAPSEGAHKAAADRSRPGSYRDKAAEKQRHGASVTAPATTDSPLASNVAAPSASALPDATSLPGAVSPRGPDMVDGLREAAQATGPEAIDKSGEPSQPQQTVVRAGVRPASRTYSIRSEEALSALNAIEIRLKQIEDRVADLDAFVRGPGPHTSGFGKAKTELASLEADAHKLESTGVDSIYTGELDSGRASAKEKKKEELRRLEALFNRIDDIFRVISTNSKSSSATATVPPDRPVPSATPPHSPQLAPAE